MSNTTAETLGAKAVDADTDTAVDSATAADSATTVETDATSEPGSTKTKDSGQKWLRRIGFATIIVLLIAATVLACVFGWKLKSRNDVDTAAQQASGTAQSYAVSLTSIDHQNIDKNFTDVLNGATGEFKDMYAQSSGQLKDLLVKNNAASSGKVIDSSIKSAAKDRVEVLLFVDQTVTNSQSPDPRVDRSRIVITMERVGNAWLASKVDLV